MDNLERAKDYLDGNLNRKDESAFWMEVASNKEVRTLFYVALIERWNEKLLSPSQKELAVKLYKESVEFREYFDLMTNEKAKSTKTPKTSTKNSEESITKPSR